MNSIFLNCRNHDYTSLTLQWVAQQARFGRDLREIYDLMKWGPTVIVWLTTFTFTRKCQSLLSTTGFPRLDCEEWQKRPQKRNSTLQGARISPDVMNGHHHLVYSSEDAILVEWQRLALRNRAHRSKSPWHWMQYGVHGTASSRASLISLLQDTHCPKLPSRMRTSANSTARRICCSLLVVLSSLSFSDCRVA